MTSVYEGKVLAKVQLIHVEQMSLHNFIISRPKIHTFFPVEFVKLSGTVVVASENT